MTWRELDETVVTEWQRRRAAYRARSRPIWIGLAASLFVLIVALLLPFSSVPVKLGGWLLFFAALCVIDHNRVRWQLLCPSCNRVPFLSGGRLSSSSNPVRCFHCAVLLRPMQPAAKGDDPRPDSARKTY